MTDLLETLQKLPPICASRLPSDDSPILIKRGVKGYFKVDHPDFDVNGFNARHGVTGKQKFAMEIGSMFGWHVPAADPDYEYKSAT